MNYGPCPPKKAPTPRARPIANGNANHLYFNSALAGRWQGLSRAGLNSALINCGQVSCGIGKCGRPCRFPFLFVSCVALWLVVYCCLIGTDGIKLGKDVELS